MKKFLSLALALVMTLSLVTISAGAATFTDDSDITYKEAVEVLTAIEVVGGYANGSFDPEATLTRGAAAKIICNLLLGPTVAAALGTNTDPFPDVSYDHTFAGYIAYCANEGIISGYSDGTFRPSGTITGFAFMKMLLGALGYDSDAEGYTATNWAVNVSADAKISGLDDGNEDYDGSKAITREEACLYALNTLEAYTVSYSSQSNITIGDIVISNNSDATISTTEQFMDISFSRLVPTYYTSDSFDRPATKWTYKGNSVGTFVDYDNMVASYEGKVTKGTLYSEIGADLYDDIDDGTVTLRVYADGKYVGGTVSDYFVKNSSSASALTGNSSATQLFYDEDAALMTLVVINTYLVQASDDYDADKETLDIDVIETNTTYYADVSSAKISIDDVDVADFEEDDYILVTAAQDSNGDFVIKSAVLAETVTGEVTTYSTNSSITLDGTKYSYNTVVSDATKGTSYTVGESATLVLDQYGNVLYVDEVVVGSDRYVFINELGVETTTVGTGKTFYAAAYFTDGTYAEIVIDDMFNGDAGDTLTVSAGSVTNATTYEARWYAYTTNSDGSYDLLEVESKYLYEADNDTLVDDLNQVNVPFVKDITTAAGSEIDYTPIVSGQVQFSTDPTDSSNYLRGNSSTVFVIDDGDDVIVYTGISNVPDLTLYGENGATAATVTVYGLKNTSTGYASYVFVDASETDVAGSSNSVSDYVFILNVDSTTYTSDDPVYTYNALIDGEETQFQSENGYTPYTLWSKLATDGDYYKVTGEIATTSNTSDEQAGSLSIAPTYEDGVVTFATGVDYIIDDDTIIWNIVTDTTMMDDDGNKYEADDLSGSNLAKFYKEYSSVAGYYYVILDDGIVQAIYVYATGATYAASLATSNLTAGDMTLTGVGAATAAAGTAMTTTMTGTNTTAGTYYLMNGTTVLASDFVDASTNPVLDFTMPEADVVLSLSFVEYVAPTT